MSKANERPTSHVKRIYKMKKNKNIYAVILAGGSGTRFWPLSRKANPKQFLSIVSKRSLLQETVERIRPLTGGSGIYFVTNRAHRRLVQQQAGAYGISAKNILSEPQGKNTAPAVCWAASRLYRENPDAVMLVLPSDHLITNPKTFLRHMNEAVRLAQERYLVTLGIVPTRPETGYGYLKTQSAKHNGKTVNLVEQFTEKPSLPKARRFLKSGRYLWNSGMFVWRCDVILNAFQKHLPDVYQAFQKAKGPAAVQRMWSGLPGISIDYGILEKASAVACVPAGDIGWSDLGSWESLAEILPKDAKKNILQGTVAEVACENTCVFGDRQKGARVIAAVGLKDVIIVDTRDALLVCRRDTSQRVKDIVEIFQRQRPDVI